MKTIYKVIEEIAAQVMAESPRLGPVEGAMIALERATPLLADMKESFTSDSADELGRFHPFEATAMTAEEADCLRAHQVDEIRLTEDLMSGVKKREFNSLRELFIARLKLLGVSDETAGELIDGLWSELNQRTG